VTHIPTYEQIKNARGACPDCNGHGKICMERFVECYYCDYFFKDNTCFERHYCATCKGTTNRIITLSVSIDVPGGYEFIKLKNHIDLLSSTPETEKPISDCAFFLNHNGLKIVEVELPCKIDRAIKVTCDECGGRGRNNITTDSDINEDCPVCNGNPEATITFIGITVVDKTFKINYLEGTCNIFL